PRRRECAVGRLGGAVTAAELLAELTRQGVTLAAEGAGIRVTPASRLCAALRGAVVAHKSALLELLRSGEPSPASAGGWDQAEADRLLAEAREALAHAEAERRAGRMTEARRNVVRTWLWVCEGYARDHEKEARRGWDALDLLRGASRRAVGAA